MASRRKAILWIFCWIGFAGIYAPGAIAEGTEVTVCHRPSEDPGNAQTIIISEDDLDAYLERGATVGACDSEQAATGQMVEERSVDEQSAQEQAVEEQSIEVRETATFEFTPACACPKPGVWRVTNRDGWMECNVLGIKRKLKGPGKNDGAIWILNDDCSTIFSDAYEKDREDVLMDRGRDCLFFGVAPGKEQGAEAIFDGAYKLETEEFITGEYYMEMSGMGADCSGYRPFEIEFLKPLSAKDYAKLEKKMQKALKKAREKLAGHREQIDRYLEKTDGGLAFGGRNAQQ